MTRLILIELRKLATTRLSYGLLAAAVGVSALFAVVFQAAKGGSHSAPISTAAGLDRITTDTAFALLLAAILGVTISSGEFRHHTATATYLAFPRRAQVMIAKACAAAVAGTLFGVAGGVVTTVVGLVSAGGTIALGAGTLAGHIGGAAVAAGLLAAAGACLGSPVRGQLGAGMGVLIWSVIVEPFLGGLFTAARPYLPYTAANTLGGAKVTSAFFGAGQLAPGPGALPFIAAAALLAAVAIVLGVIAARFIVPRDIT